MLAMPRFRARRAIAASFVACWIGISGCDPPTWVAPDPIPGPTPDSTSTVLDVTQPCPQTYEFGNYGCARTVVMLSPPSEPLPDLYRLDVRARWADPPSMTAGLASPSGENPRLTPILLTITLWDRNFVPAADTASLWITARILDDVRPIVVNVPLPIFASDSTLHALHFASVGSIPRVDTVRFRLKRP